MTLNQLKKEYGENYSEIARKLGANSRCVVWQWFKRGNIPEGWQYKIEVLTGGRLKAKR